MGNGTYSVDTHAARKAANRAAGRQTFHHTHQVATGAKAPGVSDRLDPKRENQNGPFAGKITRSSEVSTDHPNPRSIAVMLDVTGSNIEAATAAHGKLPTLLGVLTRKGYVEDPQILFGAVGDAHTDYAPLQVGQFESDNRLEEDLEDIFLEGNGGGQARESYELAAYFLANHTHLDSVDKNGQKGYAFFIGDEMPYSAVRRQQVQEVLGETIEADLPTKEVFDKLKETYEVFFLFQKQGLYDEDDVLPAWKVLLNERALTLDDPEAVAETIGLTIGLVEGAVTLEDGMEDLKDAGATDGATQAAGKALATISATTAPVAQTTGTLPDSQTDSGTERL